jgi:TorA maturation chaperone TorD
MHHYSIIQVKGVTTIQETDRMIQYALLSRMFQNQLALNDLPVIRETIGKMSRELQDQYHSFLQAVEKGLQDKEAEQALQVEYAHLFLLPEGVKPYESVYRSSERMLLQKPWQAVKHFYHSNGFVLEEEELHPEDHVSVELAFMAVLIEHGEQEDVQQSFLTEHVMEWLPDLLEDIIKNPYASFYREAAYSGQRFMEKENEWLEK